MSGHSGLEHEVIIARNVEDCQKCLDIRFEVFHKEQKFPADTEIDEYDKGDSATHFLLRLTPPLMPIGTIRCVKLAPFTYKLSRLAVLKNCRKQNFGRFLVLALHDWVQQQARKELIDNTEGHRILTPINSAALSEQEYTNPSCPTHAKAHTITDDHPDEDLNFRSMSCNIRNAPSSTKIITHSQIPVEGFYTRLGYKPEGEQFDEDGELHQKMVIQLPFQQVLHVK